MDRPSTAIQPNRFTPGVPRYPALSQTVRITASPRLGIYPAFLTQGSGLTLRDRTPCYAWEPNGVGMTVGSHYRGRLAGTYLGLPLVAVGLSCCKGIGSVSPASSSSSSVSPTSHSVSSSLPSSSSSSVSVTPIPPPFGPFCGCELLPGAWRWTITGIGVKDECCPGCVPAPVGSGILTEDCPGGCCAPCGPFDPTACVQPGDPRLGYCDPCPPGECHPSDYFANVPDAICCPQCLELNGSFVLYFRGMNPDGTDPPLNTLGISLFPQGCPYWTSNETIDISTCAQENSNGTITYKGCPILGDPMPCLVPIWAAWVCCTDLGLTPVVLNLADCNVLAVSDLFACLAPSHWAWSGQAESACFCEYSNAMATLAPLLP